MRAAELLLRCPLEQEALVRQALADAFSQRFLSGLPETLEGQESIHPRVNGMWLYEKAFGMALASLKASSLEHLRASFHSVLTVGPG